MVFLMETKLWKEKMDLIRYKLGFPNMFVVDSVGEEWRNGFVVGERGSGRHPKFQSSTHKLYC
jgi:hypothetical protein